MTKFIIHKDSLLYTTHGFLSAEHLYNVYKSEGLKKDCCLVGWKPRGETYGKIFSIDEFDSDAGFVVSFREYGRPEKQCYYYVGSKLMDKDMNYIELSENVDPDRITLALQIEFDGVNDDLKKTENSVYALIKKDHHLAASAIADLIGLSKPNSGTCDCYPKKERIYPKRRF